MNKVDEFIGVLGLDYAVKLPFVVRLSERTKIPANILVTIGIVLFSLLCLTFVIGNCFTTLIMFLIPAYDTFKAIEEKNDTEQVRLLTYWMVFGTFFSMDETFRWIFQFLPMYHLIRFAILTALYSKTIGGAEFIYRYVQQPFFLKFESTIDGIIKPVEDSLEKIGEKFYKAD